MCARRSVDDNMNDKIEKQKSERDGTKIIIKKK